MDWNDLKKVLKAGGSQPDKNPEDSDNMQKEEKMQSAEAKETVEQEKSDEVDKQPEVTAKQPLTDEKQPEVTEQPVPAIDANALSAVAEQLKQFVDGEFKKLYNRLHSESEISENKTSQTLEKIFNGLIHEDKTDNKKYYGLSYAIIHQTMASRKLDDISSVLQRLLDEQVQLRQIVADQQKTINEQASIIRRQHENLVKYENDIIYKSRKDTIKEIIDIADQVGNIVADQQKMEDYSLLLENVKMLDEWIGATMQTISVRRFKSENSAELDRKRQEIVDVEETSLKEEDGLLKSLQPGYIWSFPMVGSNELNSAADGAPKMFEFVIRPEQMVRMKYAAPIEESKAEETPAEEVKQEETPADEPKAEETPAGNVKTDETPADEPKAEN